MHRHLPKTELQAASCATKNQCSKVALVRPPAPQTFGREAKRELRPAERVTRSRATEKSQVATESRHASSEHQDGARQASSEDKGRAVSESLRLLEWPALCRQVAAFASISITARDAQRDGLHIGTTQEESERLQQQTAEAGEAGLVFSEIYNMFPVVEASKEGRVLNARHLNAVASTLRALDVLKEQIQMPSVERNRQAEASTSTASGAGRHFPSLEAILRPAAEGAPSLVAAIRHCIGEEDYRVLDRSSERLAGVRAERSDNLAKLRAESERWARQMLTLKASENQQVMNQRGRLCVSIRAGRQGELPKGSVKVGASRTGATLYFEPAPLVELNNLESWLADQEAEAEREVLRRLSSGVSEHSSALLKAMHAILELDVINARAQHGAWLSGTRPRFLMGELSTGCMHLPGARHPLLMQRALPPLPDLLEFDEDEFESSFTGGVAALQLGALNEMEAAQPSGDHSNDQTTLDAKLPQPVDLTVPPGKKSVIVTGPNTGGKTASLKTLGLLTLMAKAGLSLPLESSREDSSCGLQWFSKVLTDLGDSQDLAQNLSTFSGHVHRLKRITEAVDADSLVLLDELGSGTDPTEGGPLAAVLLEWLLDRARLTFCTSHHAELKELPVSDARFVNANVEFDTGSLMPTYRLLWGEAGQSQALAVAEGLGFDRDIVAAARDIAASANLTVSRSGEHADQLKDNLALEVENARRETEAAGSHRKAVDAELSTLEAEIAELKSKLKELKAKSEQEVQGARGAAQKRTQRLLSSFTSGRSTYEEACNDLEQLRSDALAQRALAGSLFGQSAVDSDEFVPRSGDTVRLLSMGGKLAKVVRPSKSGSKLAVRMGKLTINVSQKDVAPVVAGNSPQAKKKKPKQKPPSPPGQQSERDVLRVQIPDNTADLRGMRQADAITALERAFDECPQDSVLFVVHGHGTGAVKSAVRQHLQRHAMVKNYYEEPASAGGCTVVEFK